MSAVRGGADDQAIGSSQLNLQSMLAAANVGNGMVVGDNSPVIIQSDNTFSQDADNSNTPSNKSLLLAAFFGLLRNPTVENVRAGREPIAPMAELRAAQPPRADAQICLNRNPVPHNSVAPTSTLLKDLKCKL